MRKAIAIGLILASQQASAFMPLIWMPQEYRDLLLIETAEGWDTTNHYVMYQPTEIVSSERGFIWCWSRENAAPLGLVFDPATAGATFAATAAYVPLMPNAAEQAACEAAVNWPPVVVPPPAATVAITWQPPTKETTGATTQILNYMLNYAPTGGAWQQVWFGADLRSYSLGGLTPGAEYTLELFAQNTAGQMSEPARITKAIN